LEEIIAEEIFLNQISEIKKVDEIKRGKLTKEQQKQFDELINKYKEIFAEETNQLGRTNIVKHEIEVEPGARPLKQRFYKTGWTEKKFIKEEVERLLEEGIIQPSKSAWASPVVLVKKSDGKMRFCVDYRKLNEVTKKDAYPIPRIDEMLEALGGAKYFTTLDLASGYWQVEMDPISRDKTAFTTEHGIYEFNVMPFGLTNAPATFQRLMNQVLHSVLGNGVVVYLDDINIYTKTFEEHLKKLEEVLRLLKIAGLKIKPSKCKFIEKELTFLGHVVNQQGILPDPRKIDKVRDFPRPKTVTDIKSFLGLASYYRKFIKGFSEIAKPMNDLTRKGVPFKWKEKQEEAFKKLKQALISKPVLRYPEFDKTFYLYTDGSGLGLGAVLAQKDENKQDYVIAYASKGLTGSQPNYSATDLELLAVVWAINHFRHYLAYQHFIVVTDHSATQYLKKNPIKELRGRLARWMLHLQSFDFNIEHRPGKQNRNADVLSRLGNG